MTVFFIGNPHAVGTYLVELLRQREATTLCHVLFEDMEVLMCRILVYAYLKKGTW